MIIWFHSFIHFSSNNKFKIISLLWDQQQPPLSFLGASLVRVVAPALPLVEVDLPVFPGLLITLDLISLERVVNAFSTLTASLAEVSKNLMPKESARVFPSSVFTCLLASRSDLFPTSSLTTFSFPYLSTSASQFSMSLKDCLSVMS